MKEYNETNVGEGMLPEKAERMEEKRRTIKSIHKQANEMLRHIGHMHELYQCITCREWDKLNQEVK